MTHVLLIYVLCPRRCHLDPRTYTPAFGSFIANQVLARCNVPQYALYRNFLIMLVMFTFLECNKKKLLFRMETMVQEMAVGSKSFTQPPIKPFGNVHIYICLLSRK